MKLRMMVLALAVAASVSLGAGLVRSRSFGRTASRRTGSPTRGTSWASDTAL